MAFAFLRKLSSTLTKVAPYSVAVATRRRSVAVWGPQLTQSEGSEQKKKRMKADSDVLRLSPSMRSHLESLANLRGEQVAARVSQEDAGDEWFVVKVLQFDKETQEFEVLDEEPGDDEASGAQSLAISSPPTSGFNYLWSNH